jgi:hypothetical protein
MPGWLVATPRMHLVGAKANDLQSWAVGLPARTIICEEPARRSVIADRATVRRALASPASPLPAHITSHHIKT